MSHHPLEATLRRAVYWLIPTAALGSALLLLMPRPTTDEGLYVLVLAHLVAIQITTFAFTIVSSRHGGIWFSTTTRPWLATQASTIAVSVGLSALLTLATSAAARLDPSLQFLQLLSSLDIAWVVAATFLGATAIWGFRVGVLAGSAILLACVMSIAVYLSRVGFTDNGGWLVDGATMLRVVISSDVVAAVVAVTLLLSASRARDQPMAQPRAQS